MALDFDSLPDAATAAPADQSSAAAPAEGMQRLSFDALPDIQQGTAAALGNAAMQGLLGGTGQAISGTGRTLQTAERNTTSGVLSALDQIDQGIPIEKVMGPLPQMQKGMIAAYLRADEAGRARMRQQFQSAMSPDPGTLQRAGEHVGEVGERFQVAPGNEGIATGAARLVGGIGPLVAGAAGATVAGGPVAGGMTLFSTAFSQAYDQTMRDALARGASTEDAEKAAGINATLQTAVMGVPLGRLIQNVPAPLRDGAVKTLVNLGKHGVEFGSFNALARFLNNYVMRETVDPNQPLTEGVGTAMAEGALAGIVIPAGSGGVRWAADRTRRALEPNASAEMRGAFNAMEGAGRAAAEAPPDAMPVDPMGNPTGAAPVVPPAAAEPAPAPQRPPGMPPSTANETVNRVGPDAVAEAPVPVEAAAPVEPPAPAPQPPRIRTIEQIQAEDGVGPKKAAEIQGEEIAAFGRPVTAEEVAARKAGVETAPARAREPEPALEEPAAPPDAAEQPMRRLNFDDIQPEAEPGPSAGVPPAPDLAPDAAIGTRPMPTAVDMAGAGRPPSKPMDAVSYLIQHGGIKDPGGDIAAMGGGAYHHRQAGRLINNRNGLAPDHAREVLRDAGYLPESADINAVHDLIAEHLSGRPRYPDEYAAEAREWELGQQAIRERERSAEALDQVRAAADEAETPLTVAEMEHAARLIVEGTPTVDAVQEAIRVGDIERQNAYNEARGMLSKREQAAADKAGEGAPSEPAADARRRLATVMQAAMRYVGLPSGVGLRLVSRLADTAGNPVDAAYWNKVLTFAIDTAKARGPQAVPQKWMHEVIHGLMDPAVGVLTPNQRAALLAAGERWLKQGDNRATLEELGYTREQMAEEGVAHYVEDVVARSRDKGTILQRGADLLRRSADAVGNGLRGQGFTSGDAVLRDIMHGRVRGQETQAGVRPAPPQESRRPPTPPKSGADLFGREAPQREERKAPEPLIRTDLRQAVMPGMEPSAVQAQAARDQSGRGALTAKADQRPADEGLFAPKDAGSGQLFSKREDAPKTPTEATRRILAIPGIGRALSVIADASMNAGHIAQMMVAPMAEGSVVARAQAKDWANATRLAAWEGAKIVEWLKKSYTPEQRADMWSAADRESVMRQTGEIEPGNGLDALPAPVRSVVESLQQTADAAYEQARAAGMVHGEGLPSYVPRMVVEMVDGRAVPIRGERARNLPGTMETMSTSTPQLRHREHLTVEETEAAARAALDNPNATVLRDIATLPIATAKLQVAIAGRRLMNAIREAGRRSGEPLVVEGAEPQDGHKWFTIRENPAFWTYRVKTDEGGKTVVERTPLFVRGDYEGPLRAILENRSGGESGAGRVYKGMMMLKGRIMTGIMWGAVHAGVIAGRVIPKSPNLVRLYREGSIAKNDPEVMRRFIESGGVPIGHNYGWQEISGLVNEGVPTDRYLSSLAARWILHPISPKAGEKVASALDRANDFVHNTLVWDTIGTWQAGMFRQIERAETAKGTDPQTAARIAAHLANRLAGAMPPEAMSAFAQKAANLLLFSRSYRMGGLGQIKDTFTGLPRDVLSQIERDQGPKVADNAAERARRIATSVLIADLGLYALGNSLLQSGANVMLGDASVGDEAKGYLRRMIDTGEDLLKHPWQIVNPFWLLDIPERLSATSDNEPGKHTRIMIGRQEDGTAIYLRNPTGKFAEDIFDYIQRPAETLRRITSPFVRLGTGILGNTRGLGRSVYDPYAGLSESFLQNAWDIAKFVVEGTTPFTSLIEPTGDLIKSAAGQPAGASPAMSLAKIGGSAVGLTISKGYPGGPAKGEIAAARRGAEFALQRAMPDIRAKIKADDIEGARSIMNELHIPAEQQRSIIAGTVNPQRITAGSARRFRMMASPEAQDRFDRQRGVAP